MTFGAGSLAFLGASMASGRVPDPGGGILLKQGGMTYGAIEIHPFGMKKVIEGDTTLTGWNHQAEGKYFPVRGSPWHSGQRAQNHKTDQNSHTGSYRPR
jgi:hypothetical protein